MLLKFVPAFTEFGNGNALSDAHDGLAHLFHHAADDAARLVGAGALFIELLADATDRGQRALDVAHDRGECDFLRPLGQTIPAGNSAPAFHNAGGFEVIENLFEESLGDILLVRDGLDAHQGLVVVQAQDQQGAQSVFSTK